MSKEHPFDRYAPVTDVAELKRMSDLPLRKSKRVNTLKSSVSDFQVWAATKQWTLTPVPWCNEAFYVDRENRDEALGKDLLHVLGHTYMQEAASMLPVALLDPQPGESILDMSSAPGSKTTQIAAKLQNKGVVVANDVQEKRMWALASNLQRAGVMNVLVTKKVGQWFAGNMTERFDRVLCDAPCTAQGTARKDSDALIYCSDDNIGKMARLQLELLESAIHATKVGGRIVYSTCTLTPEENESVLGSILNKFSDQIRIIDPTPGLGFDLSKALEESKRVQGWIQSKQPFPAFRLWPQTYDTEGFFAAVLEKRAPTRHAQQDAGQWPKLDVLPPARRKEWVDNASDWYGAPLVEENELLFAKQENLHVITEEALHFRLPILPYIAGLPFGKQTEHGLARLSHEMATLRGNRARENILHLNDEQRKHALSGRDIPYDNPGHGDLLLSIDHPAGKPLLLGRGMLMKGRILNRLPREIVRMFS
ncbi:MAG TPA: NOL1/NOP2/sun family putative RNA methylase [Candidatus Peribacteria bacterium]|nr:NOL1/NOP2/sun family putative RNA methylase [Candidatus Peribacteria bacterium]